MSNYVEITGDPDEIRARGAQLAARGQAYEARAQSLTDRISSLEAGAPWGGDRYGRDFLDNENGGYHSTKHTDEPFNEYVKNGATGIGPKLTRTGEAIESAMTGYQFADLDNERDISAVPEE
jgi:hypothetical protein